MSTEMDLLLDSQMDEHERFMEKARVVIFGEASTLSTLFLKNNQRLTKSNYVQLSRLSSLILEDEDEIDVTDEYLVVDPLIKGLILLKSRLSKEKIILLDHSYIKPFCDVIVNKDVSGIITGLALQSVLKFLNYGFIKDDEMVRLIAESVIKARFVGSNSIDDEVVLLRMLFVFENLVLQPFYSLTNGLVCEIMQSCFGIAFDSRITELLRKSAIKCMTEMVRALFSRISHFDQDISDYNYFYQDKSNASFHKLNRMGRRFVQNKNSNKQIKINKEDLSDSDCNHKNYGLACIHELLSYLTSLINPLPDGQNTDSMIQVGLNLLIVIFETSVQDIGNKYCLLSVVKTDLCWNIMQLLQNEKNLNTFSNALRLAFIIFVNLRMHLKYQFEAFLLKLMDIVTTMNAPLEFRDICVENLLLLFRHINFLPHELFFNFDCDPYSSNVLEDLLSLFSKNCFNNSNNANINTSNVLNFTTLQMLSFEVLLSNLKSLHKVESCEDVTFTANPATMIVNISNIKDVFIERSLNEENIGIYNVLNSAKDIDNQIEIVVNSKEDCPVSDVENQSSTNLTNVTSNELDNFELLHNSNGTLNDIGIQSEQLDVSNSSTINKYCVTYLFPDNNPQLKKSEQIIEMKHRKVLLWQASERFNQKPSKGIEFLHENKLIANDDEIVAFLKNNPKLDKKMIGEYLSNKKNTAILSKFVQDFAFKDTRIDEALRLYLESFRLPGESPLISLVLEQFAHHWHESNNCPFVNEDAAFSLAYAIIMLNVDQHNSNVKRQTNPMTCDEFISNLRQVNGGKDFDKNMLREIYYVIKNNEIVMPAEQTGVVREKYLWKCLLKNSETKNGIYWYNEPKMINEKMLENFKENKERFTYLHLFNRPIFEISWGPTVSTLTLVFDKLNPDKQPTLSRRVLNHGFTSYSLLCANYGHLDDLIVNLSKFAIASNKITSKSELVAHCLFGITKEYANEMRTSWINIIELILFWYDNKLLDDGFEIEDFAIESKTIKFARRHSVKSSRPLIENPSQSTFFSSFYSYFANIQTEDGYYTNDGHRNVHNDGSNSNSSILAKRNEYCQALVLIIEESKFLHIDSLIELIKALINVQFCEEFDDDIEVFKLEILVKVILMNRDRLSIFWDFVNRHIIRLMKYCPQSQYLTERVISAIFRLAIRFTPRPDPLNEQIFLLIYQMLLSFDPFMIQRSVTAQALHSFVSHCNCYFSKNEEWALIFNLILAVAIGYYPTNKKLNSESNELDRRGYTSDSEVSTLSVETKSKMNASSSIGDLSKLSQNLNFLTNFSDNCFSVNYSYRILDVDAYEKCADILSLIITEYLPNSTKIFQTKTDLPFVINNFQISQMAVGALCKFVEASIKIQITPTRNPRETVIERTNNRKERQLNKSRLSRLTNAILSSSESDSEDEQQTTKEKHIVQQPKLSAVTENCSLKLLNLMHFFHINATTIVGDSVGSDILWNSIWCSLLQAISFFCCDCRRPVRTHAFTFLQRTLLLHDLNTLNAVQWESCFNKVLFPLLSKLLEPINMCDPIGMDETRMRTTNLLCKVFLQHLHPLLSLNTFTALWLTILDFMDKYIKAEMQTDLVKEAIPESLKNILLVMKTAGYFNDTLASITWNRINVFLPNLYDELMAPHVSLADNIEPNNSQASAITSNNDLVTKFVDSCPNDDQQSSHGEQISQNLSDLCNVAKESLLDSPLNEVQTEFNTAYGVPIGTQCTSIDQSMEAPIEVFDTLPSSQTSEQQLALNQTTNLCNTPQALPNVQMNYNIPSTFIDMESVYIYPEQDSNSLPKPILSFSHFQGNSYPGTIAQFHPDNNSPLSSYSHYASTIDKNSTIGENKTTSTTAYPWPSPNITDNNVPFNK